MSEWMNGPSAITQSGSLTPGMNMIGSTGIGPGTITPVNNTVANVAFNNPMLGPSLVQQAQGSTTSTVAPVGTQQHSNNIEFSSQLETLLQAKNRLQGLCFKLMNDPTIRIARLATPIVLSRDVTGIAQF